MFTQKVFQLKQTKPGKVFLCRRTLRNCAKSIDRRPSLTALTVSKLYQQFGLFLGIEPSGSTRFTPTRSLKKSSGNLQTHF